MFEVTGKKGFCITFPNGWTASVQFGKGNYCNIKGFADKRNGNICANAEVAGFRGEEWYTFPDGKQVCGWQDPEKVLEFLNIIAELPA